MPDEIKAFIIIAVVAIAIFCTLWWIAKKYQGPGGD